MKLLTLRSVTATALSLWLGVVACLLGCAMPQTAHAGTPGAQGSAAPCPTRHGDADESCCAHGHTPARNPDKSGHHRMSCCPTEAALVQKQSLAAPALAHPHVAPLTLPAFDSSSRSPANREPSPSAVGHAGREILLRVHLLRI